jgi:hypothetical protein
MCAWVGNQRSCGVVIARVQTDAVRSLRHQRQDHQSTYPVPLGRSGLILLSAGVFGCQVGTYPFAYLGLPMGTTKPKVEDFSPLVNKVERRILAMVSWLSMASRATMVDSAVSSIPIYSLCSVKMHATNINSIARARKHSIWRG